MKQIDQASTPTSPALRVGRTWRDLPARPPVGPVPVPVDPASASEQSDLSGPAPCTDADPAHRRPRVAMLVGGALAVLVLTAVAAWAWSRDGGDDRAAAVTLEEAAPLPTVPGDAPGPDPGSDPDAASPDSPPLGRIEIDGLDELIERLERELLERFGVDPEPVLPPGTDTLPNAPPDAPPGEAPSPGPDLDPLNAPTVRLLELPPGYVAAGAFESVESRGGELVVRAGLLIDGPDGQVRVTATSPAQEANGPGAALGGRDGVIVEAVGARTFVWTQDGVQVSVEVPDVVDDETLAAITRSVEVRP